MDIGATIKYYCKEEGVSVDFEKDVVIMDAGNGPYIDQWNISDKLPQPSTEELETLEPEEMLHCARQNKLAELDTKFNYALENGNTTTGLAVKTVS